MTRSKHLLLELLLLVLILAFAIAVNSGLGAFEQALHRRWYRS